jgi:hypothetical protein
MTPEGLSEISANGCRIQRPEISWTSVVRRSATVSYGRKCKADRQQGRSERSRSSCLPGSLSGFLRPW